MKMDRVRGVNHIGIDLDSKDQFNLLKTFFNARYMFPDKEIRVYETRSGYHIEILGVKSNLTARRTLGDDPYRLWFSEERMRIFGKEFDDVLFNVKNGHKRDDITDEINMLCGAFHGKDVIGGGNRCIRHSSE